ncbi:hypothetical protein WB44_08145 [Synechococcus sp. WH 8020]|nr:hypothetical protein WB44_08145 [Synechococcus sp. WH 8020]
MENGFTQPKQEPKSRTPQYFDLPITNKLKAETQQLFPFKAVQCKPLAKPCSLQHHWLICAIEHHMHL